MKEASLTERSGRSNEDQAGTCKGPNQTNPSQYEAYWFGHRADRLAGSDLADLHLTFSCSMPIEKTSRDLKSITVSQKLNFTSEPEPEPEHKSVSQDLQPALILGSSRV